MGKIIRLFIVTKIEWFFIFHQIDSVCRQSYEYDFHEEKIKTSPYKYQIQISG